MSRDLWLAELLKAIIWTILHGSGVSLSLIELHAMNSRKHIIDGGNCFSSFYLSFIFQKICWRKGDKNQDSILHIQALLAKNGTSLISCHKRSYKETQNFVVCPLFCECLVIVRFFCGILMMSFCTNLLGLPRAAKSLPFNTKTKANHKVIYYKNHTG